MRSIAGLLLVIAIFLCFPAIAQPCGTPGLPPCDPGDPVPITGVEFLLGLGMLFGVRKLRQRRNSK